MDILEFADAGKRLWQESANDHLLAAKQASDLMQNLKEQIIRDKETAIDAKKNIDIERAELTLAADGKNNEQRAAWVELAMVDRRANELGVYEAAQSRIERALADHEKAERSYKLHLAYLRFLTALLGGER